MLCPDGGGRAFGFRPGLEHKRAIYSALREYDRHVSGLDARGVPLRERLSVVAAVVAPRVGLRLGVLACIADRDAWKLKALLPEIADWFEEPLSPRLVGRVVHGVLTTWDQEYARLAAATEREGRLEELGVSRRTWESWRSPTSVSCPDPKTLRGIWLALPEENRSKAEHLLRLARACMSARRKLLQLGGAGFVDQVERLIKLWATHTRYALRAAE